MDLRQLRYLIAVADELSFTAAARICNVSQPPISRAIAELERELDARLFERDSHRVTLTPAGVSLVEDARRLLDLAERSGDRAHRIAKGLGGSLTLAFGGSAAYAMLPAMVRRFRRDAPGVRLTFRPMPLSDQLEALRGGRIDLGILRLPVHDEMIATQFVHREPLSLALPSDHPLLSAPGPVRLEQLADSRFIAYESRRGFNYYADLYSLCRLASFEPNIIHEASTSEAVIGIVACGEGIALVPRSARRLGMRGVVFRQLHDRGIPARLRLVQFGLAWRRTDVSASTLEFVAMMKRRRSLTIND